MAMFTNATSVGAAVRERLEQITTANGYHTALQGAFGPDDKPRDSHPKPYALVRSAVDVRTSVAGSQATRLRTLEVEVVFSKADGEAALDLVHVDVLRALGFGQDQPERKFPGLVDEEPDEAQFHYAQDGQPVHRIIITLGVTYVATYN